MAVAASKRRRMHEQRQHVERLQEEVPAFQAAAQQTSAKVICGA